MIGPAELEYEPYFRRYQQVFGNGSEVEAYAHQQARHDHSLVVSDALRDAMIQTVNLSHYLTEAQARYYLCYGAGRRMMMLWRSYQHLIFIANPERVEPLLDNEVHELGRDINLIYMHLRGTLDNFAWCILYEKCPTYLSMNKMEVGLFSKSLRPMLKKISAWEAIQEHAEWNKEVKERRDPVAHRIPLTIPPAILTPDEGRKTVNLQNEWCESLNSMRESNFAEIEVETDQLTSRMDHLGRFVPFFMHHPDEAPIPIYPTLPNDMAHLVKLSHVVQKALAPAGAPA